MARESKIEVSIGKLKFKNAILLASGPLSNSEEQIVGKEKSQEYTGGVWSGPGTLA